MAESIQMWWLHSQYMPESVKQGNTPSGSSPPPPNMGPSPLAGAPLPLILDLPPPRPPSFSLLLWDQHQPWPRPLGLPALPPQRPPLPPASGSAELVDNETAGPANAKKLAATATKMGERETIKCVTGVVRMAAEQNTEGEIMADRDGRDVGAMQRSEALEASQTIYERDLTVARSYKDPNLHLQWN